MENNHKYFNNHNCKYYPCHSQSEDNNFNCLFCYCPLYHMEDQCGGNLKYVKNTKICVECHLPHVPDYYDVIIGKLKEMRKRADL